MNLLKYWGRDIGWQLIIRLQKKVYRTGNVTSLYRTAELLGYTGYILLRSRKRLMISNLKMVFPDWDKSKIRETAKDAVRHMSKGFADLFYYTEHPGLLRKRIRLENPEILDDILSTNKGFIIATGHIGVFPFVCMPVVWRDVPLGVVVRDPHDERVARLFRSQRSRLGMISIPDKPYLSAARHIFEILHDGGVVMFAFDMYPGHEQGIEVDFLGRKTLMFSGVVRSAASARVPILPAYIIRDADGINHTMRLDEPMSVPASARHRDHPLTRVALQELSEWLSQIIRIYPEQWWWIHRRWRG
ncbi:MAG: hypothetical protein DRG37_00555 [Deltaproteobacteria bacterium]|nr:MAG: hypothetical protein DRG37_00555 [Deltaproteobacteria bacterium]